MKNVWVFLLFPMVGISSIISNTMAMVSGQCLPTVADPLRVVEFNICTLPNGDYVNERAQAISEIGILRSSGYGMTGYDLTQVSVFSSYSVTVTETGGSGQGVLDLSFRASFMANGVEWGLIGYFSPSLGTGGSNFTCSNMEMNCISPKVMDFKIPFVYGVPLDYSINLSVQAMAWEGSFQFWNTVTLLSETTEEAPNTASVSEPSSWYMILIWSAMSLCGRKLLSKPQLY